MAGPTLQPVNFFAGANPDLYQQQMALTQQQAMAQKLMDEGNQSFDPARSAPGGWVVPYTAGEGLAHAGKQMAAALMQKNIIRQQSELAKQQTQAMLSLLRGGASPQPQPTQVASAQGQTDVPISPVMTNPQANQPFGQQASINQQPQPQAGGRSPLSITGDPNKDLGLIMAGQMFGPAYGAALTKQYEPTELQRNVEQGQKYGLDPRAAYQHTLNPPMNVRPGGTVYQPGQGAVYYAPNLPQGSVPLDTANPGAGVQAVPWAADVVSQMTSGIERGKQPFSMQTMKVPVYLPGGDQTIVEMNSMQAEQYNRTGRLPDEIAASIPGYQQPGGQPPQPQQMPSGTPPVNPQMPIFPGTNMSNPPMSVVPPEDRAAFAAAIPQRNQQPMTPQAGPARPVAGRGQTQAEQITQTRQTAAGKAVDEQFAKDYVNFTAGGGAQDAMKQLAQLDDVSKQLANPKSPLTGPVIGSMPDMALKFTGTGRNAIAMRERVEEVVQRSLRAILGAQFTEKEGERLIARAYNPNMNESENAIRVNRLMAQLHQAFQTKQDAARYFEKNGTLQGWEGKLPTMNDFEPEGASPSLPMEHDPQAIVEELRRRGVVK